MAVFLSPPFDVIMNNDSTRSRLHPPFHFQGFNMIIIHPQLRGQKVGGTVRVIRVTIARHKPGLQYIPRGIHSYIYLTHVTFHFDTLQFVPINHNALVALLTVYTDGHMLIFYLSAFHIATIGAMPLS